MLAEGGSLMGKALDVLYECLPPTVRIEEVRVASRETWHRERLRRIRKSHAHPPIRRDRDLCELQRPLAGSPKASRDLIGSSS